MNKDYLVILCSHVDSPQKRDSIIETLTHLKEDGVDVCLSTHSTEYLNEISTHVKYVIYDNNNEYLTFQDYLNNAKYIESPSFYGSPNSIHYRPFGNTSMSMPGSPHSKSALSLLRNGIIQSHLNNYKWTIYLEYDVLTPKNGFKNFIETKIAQLELENKKCFHYKSIFDSFNLLWGGFFLFETSPIFNFDKLINNKWYLNKDNWIKEWYLGFFESVVDFTFETVFGKDNIIKESIQEKCTEIWDVKDFTGIGKFQYEETFYKKNKYLRKSFQIHLYPEIKNDLKKIFLYYYNSGETKVSLDKILVFSSKNLHLNIDNIDVLPFHWSLSSMVIDISKLSDDDYITLMWKGTTINETHSDIETIKVSDISYIHKNIININFN